MKPIVEFCVNNLATFSQTAFEKLDKDRNLDVVEYQCLCHCTRCSELPMALVNGEQISAHSHEQLVEKVYNFIEENF